MKNAEIFSAVVGGTFMAVPYLALGVPVLPSIAIGAAAFAAGELVFKTNKYTELKDTNYDLYRRVENAKVKNKHIKSMIPKLESEGLQQTLKEIVESVDKIIVTVEKFPKRERKLKNFFDYYLPVTVTLVDRYDEIENQNLTSKESKKFYQNTEDTLIEINDVFKKFLFNLYQDDMIDTNVEIKVLNSMLKADGLDKNELKVEDEKDE